MARLLTAVLWLSAAFLSASYADGPIYGDPIVWVNFETETPGTHGLPGEWEHESADGAAETVTDESAPEGKAYLRLAATASAEGAAVFIVPTDLRPGAMLRLSASLRAEGLPEGAAVACEVTVEDALEAHPAVRIVCGEPVSSADGWLRVVADLGAVREAGPGCRITAFALAVRGCAPGARVTFDVDDILIEGDYNDYFLTAWGLYLQDYKTVGQARLADIRARIEALRARPASAPDGLPPALAALLTANEAWLAEECAAIEAEATRLASGTTLTPSRIDALARRVRDAEAVAAQREQAAALHGARPHPIWQMSLASSIPAPDAPVVAGRLVSELTLTALPGETRRSVVAIRPDRDLSGVGLRLSELRGSAGMLPASAWDVRHVLVQEQAAHTLTGAGFVLTPELLARDPALLERADLGRLPEDAGRLRPCGVRAGEVHAFVASLSVPADAAPGAYRGEALFGGARLPVSVEVLGLPLTDSSRDRIVDLGAALSGGDGALAVDEAQMRAVLRDVRDYGATGLVVSEATPVLGRTADLTSVRRLIELCADEGVRTDPLILRGSEELFLEAAVRGRDPVSRGPYLTALTSFAAECAALADELGCGPIALSALPGASEEVQLLANTPAETAEKAGAPVFTEGDIRICRRIAHRAYTASQAIDRREVASARQKGARLWQEVTTAGLERPDALRWESGLGAVAAGADGVLLRYWRAYGNPVDDADSPYKDRMMTYPAGAGVLPTLQWYAAGEAAWDLRYLAALDELIDQARARFGRGGFGGRTPEAIVLAQQTRQAALGLEDAEASRTMLVEAYAALTLWLASNEGEPPA